MTSQTDLHQEDRQALLKILSEVEKAINAQDIEGIIAQMRPDCTVIWWNAEISRGHDDIRAYYRRMVKDEGRYISKYTTQAKLGDHARFVGVGGSARADVLSERGSGWGERGRYQGDERRCWQGGWCYHKAKAVIIQRPEHRKGDQKEQSWPSFSINVGKFYTRACISM